MALPIGAGEIFSVAKFAFQLWQSCKAAKGEFEQVGKEVWAMRTEIELVHLECQNPSSIINVADNKEKTIHRELGIHIRNCKHALSEVGDLLKRYRKMSMLEKGLWALKGHAEVADLESNLSVLATRLNSYVNGLALKGIGMVNANLVGGFAKVQKGIGRIEKALETNNGDARASVNEVMQEIGRSGLSHDQLRKYRDIIDDYAREVCNAENQTGTPRAQTPDSSRGRDTDSRLGVPAAHRAKSANTSPSGRQAKSKKGPFTERPGGEKPKQKLECWLIQIKSAEALFVSFHLSEKEKQTRGQWKLEEMAKQFRSCSQGSKLTGNHDLVSWVLEDRKKEEKNSDFTWCFHAAKIEQKNSLYLGLGVEEQAIVIIKRKLTPEAQKKVDEKKLAAEKKAAAKKDPANESKEQPKEKKAAAKKDSANESKEQSKEKKAVAKKDPANEPKDQPNEKKGKQKPPGTAAKNGANKTSPRAPKDHTEKKQSPQHKDEAKPKKTDKPPVEKNPAGKKSNQAIEKQAETTTQSAT